VLSSDQDRETVNQLTTTEKLLDEFKDVFTGLGKLEGEYKIKLKANAKPVVHARTSKSSSRVARTFEGVVG